MSQPTRSRRKFLLQDWHRYSDNPPTWKAVLSALLFNAGFLAVFLFRMSQLLQARKRTFRSKLVRRLNLALNAAELSPDAVVGPGLFVVHPYGVGIGGGCKLGKDVTLYQGVSLGAKTLGFRGEERVTDYPQIGDGVILYAHVLVYGPVQVGDETVVLGNSVVSSDLPGHATYGGIPAKEIRRSRRYSAQDLRSKVSAEHADEEGASE